MTLGDITMTGIAKKAAFAVAVLIASTAVTAGEWTFNRAKLCPDHATGEVAAPGVYAMNIPSARSCGWWETETSVTPGTAVRFRATAEVALDAAEKGLWNDCMMFVTWYDPKRGNRKGVRFIRSDFIDYSDTTTSDGKILRSFDKTFPVPGDCNTIRVEFIAKWHKMKVKISGFTAEAVPMPKPRIVRCVVGNPHQKYVKWSDPDAVVAFRLKQIEDTLTNIFAHVENPDIILFAETFADTGSPCPEKTAERIPGGPSFALASRYAVKYNTHIAMCIRERTDAGTFHNSTFIVDRKGKLAGVYRKTTLTSGEYMAGLLPADDFGVFDLDFGRVGCLTCWDNWFSETAKFLRRKGAELLLFPLAGCGWDHVDISFPARAIDTGLPIMVAMRQGQLPNGIIDRDGTWRTKTFEDNGFAWADIDLDARHRVFWLSVGPGLGDAHSLYVDESRPELYIKQKYK